MPAETSIHAPLTGYEARCVEPEDGRAIRELLDRVGDKWSLLIVATLRHGPLRFTDLRTHIPGISQRMLTLTVRHLERDGLVTRTVFARVPPRVDYALTDLGHTLLGPAIALGTWAIAHQREIEAARKQFDTELPSPV